MRIQGVISYRPYGKGKTSEDWTFYLIRREIKNLSTKMALNLLMG